MEPSCVRQDLIPGTSRFFGDYLYHFERLTRFFPYASWDVGQVAAAAGQVQFPEKRRSELVSALRQQNGDSEALAKLARPGTVAVVTGQQVGFLSGPAYTFFKALTAVKLAAQLEQQGIAAVPVFWLATEDHDFDEVNHAWVFNEKAEPSKIVAADSRATGGPVGAIRLGGDSLVELRAGLGHLPFAEDVLEAVKPAYRAGETLGGAFRQLVQQLLKGFGLLYLDPLASPIRELSTPFLTQVAGRVPELLAGLRERNEELTKAGYHAQVHVDEDSSLLFLLQNGRRLALRWKDGQFVSRDRSYSVAELETMGEKLSPNALLRPVMQDYLLPTASYVGGPAEIAYMAQGAVLYEKLLGRMPVMYPRNSFTLLDTRAEKLLGKYGLRIPDLFGHREQVTALFASKLVPESLTGQLRAARANTAAQLRQLERDLLGFDPTIEAAARKSAAKVEYQFEKLERKTAREALHRNERASEDAAYLIDLIYPHRHLQERLYSILPFLAKHGLDLPEKLLANIQLSCPDHMARTF